MPSPLRPSDPREVGPYRLTGCLGSGGQGVVYLGESPTGQPVAVKMLHARLSEEPQARERFLREIAAARQVRQFCTARVLDADTSGDRPYVVSEYVEGISLSRLITEQGPRDPDALERLAVATVTALAAIHQAGVVHRDFKPSNVICGSDGPRVIDFGLARVIDSAMTNSAITNTSEIVGTPTFMAPEHFTGAKVTAASDMFSWAATMVYAASGRPPFGRDSIPAVFHRILHEEPDLPPLTEPVRTLVVACLNKRAEDRPTATGALFVLLGHGVPGLTSDPGGRAAPGVVRGGAHAISAPPPAGPMAPPAGPAAQAQPAAQARPDPPTIAEPAHGPASGSLPGPVPGASPGGVLGRPLSRRTVLGAALGVVAAGGIGTGLYFAFTSQETPGGASPTLPPPSVTPSTRQLATFVAATKPAHPGDVPDSVFDVAFSPDGKRLATCGEDKITRLWDAGTHRTIATMHGHSDAVQAVAFSPDGETLATGGSDSSVRLWSVPAGKEKDTLTGHSDWVSSVTFDHDGAMLATASRDRTVRLWNPETGAGTAILTGHTDWVAGVAFSPDGRTLASAGYDRTVRLWDPVTGDALAELRGHDYWVLAVAFSPDGRTLASAGADRTVRLWDVPRRRQRAVLTGHDGWVDSVAFAPGGKIIASAGYDRTVRLWDLASGRCTTTLKGAEDWVMAVAFSPDGKTLAGVCGDSTARLWSVAVA